MNKLTSPYLQIILASIIRGSGGIFVKIIALPSPIIAFFRLGIPVMLLGGYLLWKRQKLFHQDTKKILLMSTLNAARMYLFFVGYLYTMVANAVVMQYTRPIFVLILAAIFLGEVITRKKIISILLACIGIFIIYINQEFSFESHDFIGMTAMLGAALISAYINIIFKEIVARHGKREIVFYQCLVGAIIFAGFFLGVENYPSSTQIEFSTLYALLIGIIGYGLYFHALPHVSAGKANILTYIEMVSAMTLAFFILGEIPGRNTLLGAICIISAIVLLRKEEQ